MTSHAIIARRLQKLGRKTIRFVTASNDDEAYIELDLGKGETEEILESISPFFRHRSGKKFKWSWNRRI